MRINSNPNAGPQGTTFGYHSDASDWVVYADKVVGHKEGAFLFPK
jgi:hypothetical protein